MAVVLVTSALSEIPGESTLRKNFQQLQEGEGRRTPNPLYQGLPAFFPADNAPAPAPAKSHAQQPPPAAARGHGAAGAVQQRQQQQNRKSVHQQVLETSTVIRTCVSVSSGCTLSLCLSLSILIAFSRWSWVAGTRMSPFLILLEQG